MHTIKPLDTKKVIALAKECTALVTVEEHQITGGLGGAVAEMLAREHPTPMAFIGVQNQFGQTGSPDELLEHYKLTAPHIVDAVRRIMHN